MNLFIFRRDFRVVDNRGLLECPTGCIPIFIGTPEQLVNNKYGSDYSVQFMYESLKELEKDCDCRIHCFFGDNVDVLREIARHVDVESINYNRDYTPYALKRDDDIRNLCEELEIDCNEYDDYLLVPPGEIVTGSGTTYKVYGQFNKRLRAVDVDAVSKKKVTFGGNGKKLKGELKEGVDFLKKYFVEQDGLEFRGGRKNALKRLKKSYSEYDDSRDELNYETTRLSAYIKFGCVSIREVYWTFKKKKYDTLVNQLIWRDFYYNIIYAFPKNIGHSMRERFLKFKWINNKKWFKAWCEGKTGFPIVDAGMRQLNETGYMHNRTRLITSNFLVRILICDWRWGEQYYASKLIDYDPAVNNGNWQWSAGSGTDTAPFSQRIFNPWLQSEKFDPDCEYIKKWIPELADVSNKDIHNWFKSDVDVYGYPKPIVDYKDQRAIVKKIWKESA